MNRRQFLGRAGGLAVGGVAGVGCRSGGHATVMKPDQSNMVGSHAAGSEIYGPLVNEAVDKLLARQPHGVRQAGVNVPQPAKRICFACLENKSGEELGDFREQIYQLIDNRVVQSGAFQPISKRFVEAGLRQVRLRPDELFLPNNQRTFQHVMEQQGQPFDYLLFATLTSGTTRDKGDQQRDYLLTLELVDIHTGTPDKESAMLRKGYYGSRVSQWMHK